MNLDHVATKILITGKSGSGKTTLFLNMIINFPARWKFIYDPERDISKRTGWPVCLTVEEMNGAVVSFAPVCYDGSLMYPGDRPQAFSFFCRYVYSVCKRLNGVKLFAADEIQNYQRPGLDGLPIAFAEMVDEGRKQEIDMILIGQRLNRINDVIRSQLTEIITFLHTNRLQLDWLEESGFDREQIKSLKFPGGNLRLRTKDETLLNPATRANPKTCSRRQ